MMALIAITFGIGAALLFTRLRGNGNAGAFRTRKLLTDNEAEFFGRLVVALPDHYIFPQVAMSALIESTSRDKKKAHGDRLRVAQQRVDFVICDRSIQVIAVVELDDQTHSRVKDQVRDARLLQAGIRTVRFQSKGKPGVDAIRAAILPVPAAEVAPVSVPA
jgi:hypothetical protein